MSSSETCSVCGKRGKRPCPAKDALICPACCGSNRGNQLQCPAECSYFPFAPAGYDLWQSVNQSWAEKTARYVGEKLGQNQFAMVMRQFLPAQRKPTDQEALAAYFPAIHHGLLVLRDPAGKTVADHWEAENWRGLNNDETFMMRFRRKSVVTVIESQKTLDHQTVECVDLFEPEAGPIRIMDRATASSLPRFTKLMVWLTQYPYYSRIGAAGVEIPDELWPIWRRIIDQNFAEQQKAHPEMTIKQFLAEHMPDSPGVLQAIAEELRRRILASMDAHRCLATFRLTTPVEQARAAVAALPEFAPAKLSEPQPQGAPELFEWALAGQTAEMAKANELALPPSPAGAGPKLGLLRLSAEALTLETFSLQKHQLGRQLLEKVGAGLWQFENESIVDLAQRAAQVKQAWQSAGGPRPEAAQSPTANMTPDQVCEQHRNEFAKLLDLPMRHLDGATPRAAAKDASLRPKLVDWLKAQLRHLDVLNRQNGWKLDLDSALDELQVPELK